MCIVHHVKNGSFSIFFLSFGFIRVGFEHLPGFKCHLRWGDSLSFVRGH